MTSYLQAAEAIVREHGTKNEVERLNAGVLPEQELDQIVSDVLFAPILDLPIRRKAKEDGVRKHAMSLGLAKGDDKVNFRIIDQEQLDALEASEWDTLQRIQQKMPEARVKTFEVVVECGRYKRRSTYASVEMKLGERVRRLDVMLNPNAHQRGKRPGPEVIKRRPGTISVEPSSTYCESVLLSKEHGALPPNLPTSALSLDNSEED